MSSVLMIVLDDVNAWMTLPGIYGGTIFTPHMDALTARGVNFSEAHTPAPICNPARSSVLSGLSPHETGVLSNMQNLFDRVAPEATLPAIMKMAGFTSVTAGKVFHGGTQAQIAAAHSQVLSVGRADGVEQGHPDIVRTGPSQGFGIWTGDPDLLTDGRTVSLVEDFLDRYTPAAGSRGLMLNVGMINTHAPWVAPREFFDLYPLEGIVLPDPANDLDDVPAWGRLYADPLDLQRLMGADLWRKTVQAYLATISYVDGLIGRLMAALDASAIADDTMVVLWSDHGFHHGEKQALNKNTLWAEATRAPLVIALPGGARAGETEARPVSLLDVFATILDFADVPIPDWARSDSLLGLVRSGDATGLPLAAVSVVMGSLSVRTETHRYTLYEDGSAELYDAVADPRERANLAGHPAHAATEAALAALLQGWADEHGVVQNRGTAPLGLAGDGGHDLLIAGFGADTLDGGAGNDVYLLHTADQRVVEAAGGGIDTILIGGSWTGFVMPAHVERLVIDRTDIDVAGPGRRRITGNADDNHIRLLELSASEVLGGVGADTLITSLGAATLRGEAGDDRLAGSARHDLLVGGAGRNLMSGGAGNDTYVAGLGQDSVFDTAGTDAIDVSAWGRAGLSIAEQRDGLGRLQALLLRGAGGGEMRISAVGGKNPIEALVDGAWRGLMVAGALTGGAGAETLAGTAGADTLTGGGGADLLQGGAGDDVLRVTGPAARVAGGAGFDRLLLSGDGAGLALAEIERIELAGGARLPAALLASEGLQSVSGLGFLMVAGSAPLLAFRVALSGVTLLGDAAANDLRLGDAPILARGGDGRDLMLAGAGGQTLFGDAGQDTLSAGGGDDRLHGGAGADALLGGGGADTLMLDRGEGDVAQGGAGGDLFRLAGGSARIIGGAGADTLLASGDLRGLSMLEVELIGFESHAVLGATQLAPGLQAMRGLVAGVTLSVQGRFDASLLALSDLRLLGGARADAISAGGPGVTLLGNGGADRLTGGAGAETLRGGAGRDLLRGGAGNDLLAGHGTAGADVDSDRFLFAPGDGADTILGFAGTGAARDRIELLLGEGAAMRFAAAEAAGLVTLEAAAGGVRLSWRAAPDVAFADSVWVVGATTADLAAATLIFGP